MISYTLKEASRQTGIGVEGLKRACQQGLIKATALPNNRWVIGEEALKEFVNGGAKIPRPSKKTSKEPQPEGLRRWREEHPGESGKKRSKKQAA